MSNLLPPVDRNPAIHGVDTGGRQGEMPVCDMLGSPMARFLGLLLLAGGIYAAEWKDLVRRDHPRLFLNRDVLPLIKARALAEEREAFQAMRSRADALAASRVPSRDYGVAAAEAAFVFLVTGRSEERRVG